MEDVGAQAVTVIASGGHVRIGLFGAVGRLIRNVRGANQFILVLFKRDFFGVYRKSFLGWTWLIVAPLLSVLSWILMDKVGVLQPGKMEIPYPAFVLLSTAIWTLFVGSYMAAADTLNAGASFIMQVRYPHEVLLVKQLAQHAATSCINLLVIFFILIGAGVSFSWHALLLPVLALPLFLLGGGLGVFVAVASVVVPEVKRLADIGVNFLIFITPVIYSAEIQNGGLQNFFKFNPLAHLVEGCRSMVLRGTVENLFEFAVSAGSGVLVFMIALKMFYVSERYVLEKMI